MEEKNNVRQQDIVDALGGVPVLVTKQKRQQPKVVLFIVVALVLFISLISIFLLSAGSDNDNNVTQTNGGVSSKLQNEPALEQISTGAVFVVEDYIKLVSEKNLISARDTYIARDTALYELATDTSRLSVFTGSGLSWQSCTVVEATQYRAAIWTLNSIEYDVTYVPVSCQTDEGSTRELEFDIRKVDSSEGKIFDIITRKL